MLWLRGPVEAVRQIQAVDPAYRDVRYVTDTSGWTHVLPSPQLAVKPAVRSLLDLLKEIIIVPSGALDVVVALDWYKIPAEGVDPYRWPNTETGDLVSSGKYRYRQAPDPQAEAGRNLARRICNVIDRHALLQDASIVLNVPGHDSRLVSFGSRLAATVARDQGLPMIKVHTSSLFRAAAKELERHKLVQVFNDEFSVPGEVRGHAVLIVDDVIRSGTSMTAVGKAARASGANRVFGIGAVRTMRR
jgi:pyrimidine operon attenuation protein/uracil phosphoribosyltransferase